MASDNNIMELRRAIRARKSSADFGAASASQTPILFADATEDDLPVVFANDSLLQLLNQSQHDVLNQPLKNVLARRLDAASIQSILLSLSAGHEGTREFECRPLDTEPFVVTVLGGPMRAREGNLVHSFLSLGKQSEKDGHLIYDRAKLSAMYENSPGFIAASEGPEHRFTYANPAYERFVKCSDLVGKTVAAALPEIARQGFVELLDRVFTTGTPYHGKDVEFSFGAVGTDEPQLRYCDFVYQPVRAADGRVTGIFCEGYDVTQRHQAEAQLTVLQNQIIQISRLNAMGTMAATLAHELNQPLTAIVNYAAAVKHHLDGQKADGKQLAHEAIGAIADTAERTGQIIKSLRNLTTMSRVNETEFELSAAIAECVQLIVAGADPGLQVVDRTRSPIMVSANRIQLQQVVINLLKNGVEATDGLDAPRVEIFARVGEGPTTICVKDNGRGVCDEAATTLFTLNKSTKETGMGIGLSVSRTIVEAHGGRIWLEHSSPKGAEFCFTLAES